MAQNFEDQNENGYPDQYESEEAALMAQISARRKKFMQGAGAAEQRFVGKTDLMGDKYYPPADDNMEETAVNDLFK